VAVARREDERVPGGQGIGMVTVEVTMRYAAVAMP